VQVGDITIDYGELEQVAIVTWRSPSTTPLSMPFSAG
jgi:hypothetical protein